MERSGAGSGEASKVGWAKGEIIKIVKRVIIREGGVEEVLRYVKKEQGRFKVINRRW